MAIDPHLTTPFCLWLRRRGKFFHGPSGAAKASFVGPRDLLASAPGRKWSRPTGVAHPKRRLEWEEDDRPERRETAGRQPAKEASS
jgi:hypothetical protein